MNRRLAQQFRNIESMFYNNLWVFMAVYKEALTNKIQTSKYYNSILQSNHLKIIKGLNV